LLGRIPQFTPQEVSCALELVDLSLVRPDQPDYFFRIAAEGEQVLGYICYGPTPMTSGTFDLYWVAADPSAGARGIGTRLVEAMEADLRARGGRLVRVETSAQEAYGPTRDFYAKNRYAEVARVPEFYKPGDDLVILAKKL
jgi:ribosomal protein S18 acetylase RimI-like enzyme